MKKIVHFLGFLVLCCFTSGQLYSQCITAENTYVDLNSAGGAPCSADGVAACSTTDPDYTASGIGVYGSEAYVMDGVVAGASYTFDMCSGVGVGAWIPEVTILAPDGSTVDAWNGEAATGSVLTFADQCSLTWTASQSGTYTIIINELGTFAGDAPSQVGCNATLAIDNGNPTVSCGPGSLPTCACLLAADWVDAGAGTTSPEQILLCNATNDTILVAIGVIGTATAVSADNALVLTPGLPSSTIGFVAYTDAEIAAAGGTDNIIFADSSDLSCTDTLVVDLSAVTDVATFCAGTCNVGPTWVDIDAGGAPIISPNPVPFCSATADTITLLFAALGDDTEYNLTASAGTLGAATVANASVATLALTQADFDALPCGDTLEVTIGMIGVNDPNCNDSLVVSFAGIVNIGTACGGTTDGCTDPTACNFDPLASTDDGSCIVAGTACPTLDDPFGEADAPVASVDCDGNPELTSIDDCNFAGEYATINNLVIGETYCFSTDDTTDNYLTMYEDVLGAAIAEGPADGSVCIVAATTTVFMQINLNDGACGTAASCIESFVSCTSCPAPIVGCTNPVADNYDPAALCDDGGCVVTNTACPLDFSFGSTSTPPTESGCVVEIISTITWAGDYNTITNVVPGETYCFGTENGASDYVTIYDDVAGAPLADGPADGSVCVTATATATFYMQVNLNDMACGEESVSRDTYITCQSCPAPTTGCTNPCAGNYDPAAVCDDGSCAGGSLAPNDLCENATPLALNTPVSGNTDCSTLDAAAAAVGTCNTPLTGVGNWYTIEGNGFDYTASLCGSAFDTKIHVFTGDCTSGVVCVDGNDDECGLQSEISFPTAAGTTYYIYVSGFGTTASGDYTLNVSDACVLADGDCLPIERVCMGNALYVPCFNDAYVFTWTNADTGASTVVTGTAYFSPTETGTYYVEISDAAGTFVANGQACSTFQVDEIIDCTGCGE